MAAGTLSADRDCQKQDGQLLRYKLAASKTLYKGALVGAASGLIQPHADGAAEPFVGVAYEQAVSGASDTVYARVEKTGVFTVGWYDDDAAGAADLHAEVYVVSDAEVSPNASGSGATKKAAQNTKCGTVVGIVDNTHVRIRIDNYVK